MDFQSIVVLYLLSYNSPLELMGLEPTTATSVVLATELSLSRVGFEPTYTECDYFLDNNQTSMSS